MKISWKERFLKHPKKTLLLFLSLLLIILIIVIELFLKVLFPINVAFIGHRNCENGKRFGWGFAPHEDLVIYDPDTGQKFSDKMNSNGWRDREHSYENPDKSFRILTLGDSVTFGSIVPMNKSYPFVLQKLFESSKHNVEVINISYGGWGTDQQLEALKAEGLKYKPNLIILQFSQNDLYDNSYFEKGFDERKGWKPFYYSIDKAGKLVRKKNPYFGKFFSEKEKLIYFLNQTEITKRLLRTYAYFHFKNKFEGELLIDKNTAEQLLLNDIATKNSKLYKYIRSNAGMSPDIKVVNDLLKDLPVNKKKKALRILRNLPLRKYWSQSKFFPQEHNIDSYNFKLWKALINKIDTIARDNNIPVILWPEKDSMQLSWERHWGRITENKSYESAYFALNNQVRSVADEIGWQYVHIDNIERGETDSHPNEKGNKRIARKFFDIILSDYLSVSK